MPNRQQRAEQAAGIARDFKVESSTPASGLGHLCRSDSAEVLDLPKAAEQNEVRKGRSSGTRGPEPQKDRPFYRVGADRAERVRQERGICRVVPNRQQRTEQTAGAVQGLRAESSALAAELGSACRSGSAEVQELSKPAEQLE